MKLAATDRALKSKGAKDANVKTETRGRAIGIAHGPGIRGRDGLEALDDPAKGLEARD